MPTPPPQWLKTYWGFAVITCLFFIILIFIGIKKENIYVNANDTLDSNIAYYKVYRDAWLNHELGEDFVPPLLGGDAGVERLFERSLLSSGMTSLVYLVFPPYTAYVVMFFIRMFLGISGWLLLTRALFNHIDFKVCINYFAFIGFAYGILPVWPMGIGITLLPFVLAICILAYQKNTFISGLPIILYPTLGGASLALYGVFILIYLAVFVLADTALHRKINKGTLSCLCLLMITYALLEHQMIYTVISGHTIRTAAGAASNVNFHFFEWFADFMIGLLIGQYHSGTNQLFFAFPCCMLWFIGYNIYAFKKKRNFREIILTPYNICFFLLVINAVLYACAESGAVMQLLYKIVPFLKGLNFSRFLFLNPVILYICFTLIVFHLVKRNHRTWGKILIAALSASVILGSYRWLVIYNDIGTNIYRTVNPMSEHPVTAVLTWKEIYSEDLFDRIKKDIDYQKEWSVAYGFVPAILNYNGIRTLDGYDSGYTPDYKESFARLIRPYLDSGGEYAKYFETSGIRAYVFNDDLGYLPQHFCRSTSEVTMLMDMDVFREMDGVYVFSVAHIANSGELGLTLIGDYTDESSPYRMSVYKIIDK